MKYTWPDEITDGGITEAWKAATFISVSDLGYPSAHVGVEPFGFFLPNVRALSLLGLNPGEFMTLCNERELVQRLGKEIDVYHEDSDGGYWYEYTILMDGSRVELERVYNDYTGDNECLRPHPASHQ